MVCVCAGLAGDWISIGPDGGDMHFVYLSGRGRLFVSHGFGGVWYSDNKGRDWHLIRFSERDVHFSAITELSRDVLIAGGRQGLWLSNDGGLTWKKLGVISEGCEVSSLASIKNGNGYEVLIGVTSKPRAGVSCPSALVVSFDYQFNLKSLRELNLEGDGRASKVCVESPQGFVIGSSGGGLWLLKDVPVKLSDLSVTSLSYAHNKLYVGTLDGRLFIGQFKGDQLSLREIQPPFELRSTVYFFVADPINPHKLWIGTRGFGKGIHGRISDRGPKDSSEIQADGSLLLTGLFKEDKWTTFWTKGNYASSIAIDSSKRVLIDGEEVSARAFVTQGGHGCLQVTEDGGKTWKDAYKGSTALSGINGDTVNAITPLDNGTLKGHIVVTCVSGTQILRPDLESWIPNFDLRLGDIGYGLPGYVWKAESLTEPLEGKYDLLLSTGYPPEKEEGNGVYAVDLECVQTTTENTGIPVERPKKTVRKVPSADTKCVKLLTSGSAYDLELVDHYLYVGLMKEGVKVVDLKSGTEKNLPGFIPGEAGLNLMRYDNYLLVNTYIGPKKGDHFFFGERNSKGRLLKYSLPYGPCQEIYKGYRLISVQLYKGKLLALDVQGNLLLISPDEGLIDSVSLEQLKSRLPKTEYFFSDMVVFNDKAIISLMSMDTSVYPIWIVELSADRSLRITEIRELEGSPTSAIRDLELVNGFLLVATEGRSVLKVSLPR